MLSRKNLKDFNKINKDNKDFIDTTIRSLYRKIDMSIIRKIIDEYSIRKKSSINSEELIKFNNIIK